MDRVLFGSALFLGATAVIGMGAVFLQTDALAFSITLITGCVYLVGIYELVAFRRGTTTLCLALDNTDGIAEDLEPWLGRLHPSLRTEVRLRVEGERVGLPAPVLTPYLVGLLIMLGILGTFVGMVDTLKGAVSALSGTTELQAIREGLVAPMDGLRQAFGTSVAGVATSAMLGLMSTLSRRDRIVAVRRLDAFIPTVFRQFSWTYRQRETFRSLQVQTEALPLVASRLSAMADRLTDLAGNMVQHQESFHLAAEKRFATLAESLDRSLKQYLEENIARLSDTIEPVVAKAMTGIAKETHKVHTHLTQTNQESWSSISRLLADHSKTVVKSWQDGISEHNRSNARLVEKSEAALARLEEMWSAMVRSVASAFSKGTESWIADQQTSDQQRLQLWIDALDKAREEGTRLYDERTKAHVDDLYRAVTMHNEVMASATGKLLAASETVADAWTTAEREALNRQLDHCDALKQNIGELTGIVRKAGTQIQGETARVVKTSQDLIESREKMEEAWYNGHQERMADLIRTLATAMDEIRDEEAVRGRDTVTRLTRLEAEVADHLSTLGEEIASPMVKLVETASEAPKAAMDLIARIAEASAHRMEQDAGLFQAQKQLATEFANLSAALVQTSADTHGTIAQMVETSEQMLEEIGARFAQRVDGKADHFSDVTDAFAAGAVELASLGDAFSAAVERFDASNANLMENLSRIEASLDKTAMRSDEQMGYYVAQAREIIDHCMLSQQEMLTVLGRFDGRNGEETGGEQWNR